jgi:hypothetical protein
MIYIQMLNNARADLQWGKKAIFIMVEIYLNIDNELGWEESNLDGPTVVNEDAIRAAHKLLSENRYAIANEEMLAIRGAHKLLVKTHW